MTSVGGSNYSNAAGDLQGFVGQLHHAVHHEAYNYREIVLGDDGTAFLQRASAERVASKHLNKSACGRSIEAAVKLAVTHVHDKGIIDASCKSKILRVADRVLTSKDSDQSNLRVFYRELSSILREAGVKKMRPPSPGETRVSVALEDIDSLPCATAWASSLAHLKDSIHYPEDFSMHTDVTGHVFVQDTSLGGKAKEAVYFTREENVVLQGLKAKLAASPANLSKEELALLEKFHKIDLSAAWADEEITHKDYLYVMTHPKMQRYLLKRSADNLGKVYKKLSRRSGLFSSNEAVLDLFKKLTKAKREDQENPSANKVALFFQGLSKEEKKIFIELVSMEEELKNHLSLLQQYGKNLDDWTEEAPLSISTPFLRMSFLVEEFHRAEESDAIAPPVEEIKKQVAIRRYELAKSSFVKKLEALPRGRRAEIRAFMAKYKKAENPLIFALDYMGKKPSFAADVILLKQEIQELKALKETMLSCGVNGTEWDALHKGQFGLFIQGAPMFQEVLEGIRETPEEGAIVEHLFLEMQVTSRQLARYIVKYLPLPDPSYGHSLEPMIEKFLLGGLTKAVNALTLPGLFEEGIYGALVEGDDALGLKRGTRARSNTLGLREKKERVVRQTVSLLLRTAFPRGIDAELTEAFEQYLKEEADQVAEGRRQGTSSIFSALKGDLFRAKKRAVYHTTTTLLRTSLGSSVAGGLMGAELDPEAPLESFLALKLEKSLKEQVSIYADPARLCHMLLPLLPDMSEVPPTSAAKASGASAAETTTTRRELTFHERKLVARNAAQIEKVLKTLLSLGFPLTSTVAYKGGFLTSISREMALQMHEKSRVDPKTMLPLAVALRTGLYVEETGKEKLPVKKKKEEPLDKKALLSEFQTRVQSLAKGYVAQMKTPSSGQGMLKGAANWVKNKGIDRLLSSSFIDEGVRDIVLSFSDQERNEGLVLEMIMGMNRGLRRRLRQTMKRR